MSRGSVEIENLDINEPENASVSGHFHYLLYGRKLCSNVRLHSLVESEFDVRDIRFSWSVGALTNETSASALKSKRFTTNVGTDLVVSELVEGYSLLWESRCEFIVTMDGSEVRCTSDPAVGFGWMLSSLYSTVLSFTLHLQQIANIHAGCVATEQGAIGLMAAPGTGKSTLTAILAAAGYPFLTDDIMSVTKTGDRYLAHPGYPTVSLTRGSAAAVLDPASMERYEPQFQVEKARVEIDSKWATFSHEAIPLVALILLDRDRNGANLEPDRLSRVEATRAIVENTVCLPFLPKSALNRYLEFAGKLVGGVPVWRMPLPGSVGEMAELTPNVVRDIAAQAAS